VSGWRRWVRQPQGVWLRRALFQVHMWTGLAVGLYIVVVTVTGSLLVFKAGVNALFIPATIVPVSGPRLSEQQLRTAAEEHYPSFRVETIDIPRQPDHAVEVTLVSGRYKQYRLLDPYTGADLGLAGDETAFILWLVALHDDLLGGETGRKVNGAGAVLLMVMCLTGLVIWWPGVANWSRGLKIKRGSSWKRFNFDLHSMVGFWAVALLFLWAFTGAYFAFPDTFQRVADYFEPPESLEPTETAFNERLFAWFVQLHFGRLLGEPPYSTMISWVWVIVGLAPAVLMTSGVIMWWQRVIRKKQLI
jgi:uncharacterized iron-regulated membrane protein